MSKYKKNQKINSTIKEIAVGYPSTLKRIDESWDFRGAFTKEYTHCFHSYPAMMIPQIARRIIEEYGKNAKLLFDPYCGTGTSLVEANLKGINAVGIDINQLACLIAKVKTTRLNLKELNEQIEQFNDFVFFKSFDDIEKSNYIIPKITNLDFWFSKTAQLKLAIVLYYISLIKDQDISDFFKVAFSETVRESSLTKLSEFKLVRDKKLNGRTDPDVFSIMISKLNRNFIGLKEFIKDTNQNIISRIYNYNSVIEIPPTILSNDSVDIVVTSPPYGDSRTTVAYGQFSRLSSEWLGFENAKQIDKLSMGGIRIKEINNSPYITLNEILSQLKNKDLNRALDVLSFYSDYEKSIRNISKVVKRKGFVCYVVGNRTVKGVQIPNDEITKEIFESNGFNHIETIIRNIPTKKMPLKNSPTNVSGETSLTMKNEYIVILQKK
ncbi:MAG: site-specific DNA-methyltransferase [Ignavibacteria bacterium]|nr:site-specific DNA-methyltransferase [Ignavibacteria bacterium]